MITIATASTTAAAVVVHCMMRIRYVPRFVPFAVIDLPIHVNFYLLKRNSSDDYISKESKCKNPSTERRRYFQ